MTENRTLTVDEAKEGYSRFLETIKNSMDPTSNTVLLIDDEKGIRRKVARELRSFAPDIVIFEAGNGKEGLEQLAAIRKKHVRDPLFIVLDLNMPIMDGWDFITTLKKDYEKAGKAVGIPIIVLSSTSGEKGGLFTKKSVHDNKAGYNPLVAIAKEVCIDKSMYDATEGKGLLAWLKHFSKS